MYLMDGAIIFESPLISSPMDISSAYVCDSLATANFIEKSFGLLVLMMSPWKVRFVIIFMSCFFSDNVQYQNNK